MKKNAKKRIIKVLIISFSLIILCAGAFCICVNNLLGKINYVPSSNPKIALNSLLSPTTRTGATNTVNGLYHDDAITNILILGTDDYQVNDVGRSDSMLMVTVDTRHKKLKLTSFMRDLYVPIPGFSANKLNAAYHDAGGGPAGADLAVRAIEMNFGIDINHYVLIHDSAFPKIIDRLGGVTITLTSGEAKLVNEYCGDPKSHLTAGTFNLNGAQAHYYSRIRAIGNDFARTQRQRTVFTSLDNKLKDSNISTIYSALSDTLNLVTTNMTKSQMLSMAANSITYLNYPISQDRIPADNEYQPKMIANAGDSLVPDLNACKKNVFHFIYEKNIPQQSQQSAG